MSPEPNLFILSRDFPDVRDCIGLTDAPQTLSKNPSNNQVVQKLNSASGFTDTQAIVH